MNTNRFKTFGLAIVVTLVLVGTLALLASIGDAGSVILPPEKDKIDVPVGEFGGLTVADSNAEGYSYYSCFYGIKGGADGYIGKHVSDDVESIFLITPDADSASHYWDIYLDAPKNGINISDNSFMTVDFDIDLDNLYDEYRILSTFRTDSNTLAHQQSIYLYIDYDEFDQSYYSFLIENDEKKVVWNSDSNKAHITLAYSFNQDDPCSSIVNWYIDGKFIGSATQFLTEDVAIARALRIYSYENANDTSGDKIRLLNYQVNVFEKGYEGAINYLFEYPEVTLQECSDSVLFED